MAENAFRHMIATFIRQARPQTFRHGKPPRYPQRSLATAAAIRPHATEEEHSRHWQAHQLAPVDNNSSLYQKERLQKLRDDPEPRSFSSFLTDNYSREHNYLRISLTERCNLRCVYCMPEEGIQLSPPDHILTTPEIVYLSSIFVNQGVNKIRLTGGEPTVRKDILDLMRQIGDLRNDGLKELCLTTNGISLHRKLDSMVDSGLTGVNLSLDTLDPFQFTIMTRRNGHEAVMKSIDRILEMNKLGAGIKLKINCVVMRGLNDKEIIPFVDLGREKDLEVRFIEYMPFDGNKWSQNKMLSFQEMLGIIREKYPGVSKVQDHANDTSKTYKIPGFVGRVGFITSMTHNFCGTCNRLRITSDGNLKVCLFGNDEVSLRDILREYNEGKPIDTAAMEAIKQIESDRQEAVSGSTGILGASEREAKLLEVIGVAVKGKKEKHAADALRAQTIHSAYRVEPPLRNSSPFMNVRSSPAFSKSIPTHLLSHGTSPSMFQQHRYRSTFLSRRTYITRKPLVRCIYQIPTYRKIEIDPSKHVKTRENLQTVERFKKSLCIVASRMTGNARFGTMAPHRTSDDNLSEKLPSLTHLTSSGAAHMVNIGHKKVTSRSATAVSHLLFSNSTTYRALTDKSLAKGDALAVARIAGIQGAKKTADLIPLAHPGLGITSVTIDIDPMSATGDLVSHTSEDDTPKPDTNSAPQYELPRMRTENGGVRVIATVECFGKTGVEMEALTAANISTLTLYDMLKAIDKGMLITGSRVIEKKGGKSGSWRWNSKTRRIEKFNNDNNSGSSDQSTSQTASTTTIPFQSPLETVLPSPPSTHEGSTSTLPTHNETDIYLNSKSQSQSQNENNTNNETPQSIFTAEWTNLTENFSTSPPTQQSNPSISQDEDTKLASKHDTMSSPSPSFSEQNEDEDDNEIEIDLRDHLSGNAHAKPNAAAFRNARIERYQEWKKSY